MRQPEENGNLKWKIPWLRWLAGTLSVVAIFLLIFTGPGAILSEGESRPEAARSAAVGPEGDALAALEDVGVQEPTEGNPDEAHSQPNTQASVGVLTPEFSDVPLTASDINAVTAGSSASANADASAGASEGMSDEFSVRPERIDLEKIRNSVLANERAEVEIPDPGWDHEISIGRRGSLRIGYEPVGGSEARDPLSGTLDAEFVVDLFGQASVSAGYRFLNFRDLDGNQELRDALARAQVQVRF